ncbi:MAG: GtrA family protein [Desulfuromonadales bacterium]|nr:GtrA family protein [Desulfuromonadales bacterium]
MEFLTFSGVGAIGTLVHYLILFITVEFFFFNPVVSSFFGFVSGAVVNYYLNYYFTFKSKKNHKEAISKFFLVAGVGLVLNTLIMVLLTTVLDQNYLLAQLLATALTLAWNFTVNRLWTFRGGKYVS